MKYIKPLYICQLIFSITICLLCSLEFNEISFYNILSTYYAYIYLLVTIALIWIECIYSKKLSKGIYVTAGFVFVSFMYFKGIFAVTKSIMIVSIFCIINNIFELTKIKNKNGKIPFPFMSYEEQKENTIKLISFIFCIILIPFLLVIPGLKVWQAILCDIPYILIAFTTLVLKENKKEINLLINEVSNNLMYKDFEAKINQILSRDVELDTVIYLNIMKASLLLNYNKEEGIKLFNNIKRSNNATISMMYDMLAISCAQAENDTEKCHKIINNLKVTFLNKKVINKVIKRINILETNEVIQNIDKEYTLNEKYLIQNVENAILLASYYAKQKNKEKVSFYTNYVLNQKTDMVEYYNICNKILEELNN